MNLIVKGSRLPISVLPIHEIEKISFSIILVIVWVYPSGTGM